MSDEFDLLAFEVEEAAKADAETKAGRPSRRTVEGRRQRERKPIALSDGRKRRKGRKRGDDREPQLNIAVSQDLKTRVVQAAGLLNITMSELGVAAFTEFLDRLDKAQRVNHA